MAHRRKHVTIKGRKYRVVPVKRKRSTKCCSRKPRKFRSEKAKMAYVRSCKR